MQIRGVTGALVWGYYRAADVSNWCIETHENGRTLIGTVSRVQDHWLSQRAVVFEAPHARGLWRFPCETLQIEGASLTATLGPKE